MIISVIRVLRVMAFSFFVIGPGFWACSAKEDTFSSQNSGPVEDSEAKIPINIAGSGLVSCGILKRSELAISALFVCNTSKAEFRSFYLLDTQSNNVTQKTQLFRSSSFGQVLFSELTQLDKTFVADRALIEIEKDSQLQKYELRLLQAFPPIDEQLQNEVTESYKNSGGTTFTSFPLSPVCDEARKAGTLKTITKSVVIEKRTDSCLWKKGPNKDFAEGLIIAEFRNGMDFEVPEKKIICQARLTSEEQRFDYNDEFALIANDRIIAASFGGKQKFSIVQLGFPLYSWSELAGHPMKVDGDNPACYGLSPARICSLPGLNLGGKVAFDIDLPVAELQANPKRLRVDVATFGDNDSDQNTKLLGMHSQTEIDSLAEIDCTHSGLKVDVSMQLAEITE